MTNSNLPISRRSIALILGVILPVTLGGGVALVTVPTGPDYTQTCTVQDYTVHRKSSASVVTSCGPFAIRDGVELEYGETYVLTIKPQVLKHRIIAAEKI